MDVRMRTAGRSRPAPRLSGGGVRLPRAALQRPAGKTTMLYRCYSVAGELVYVGITNTPAWRFRTHQERSEWWPDVALLHTEWHDTRELAEAAEKRAVREEGPDANRKMNGRQYRYTSPRFHATRLHPIAWEHFRERPFSFPDLVAELGISTGSVTAYGNALVAGGKFQKVGRWKGPTGRMRNYYRAVPPEEDRGAIRPPAE